MATDTSSRLKDTLHIFIAIPKDCRDYALALDYSISKHCSPPYSIYWMEEGESGWDWDPNCFKYAIPYVAGYAGKAIYLPYHCLVRKDLRDLWKLECTKPIMSPRKSMNFFLVDTFQFADLDEWPTLEELMKLSLDQMDELAEPITGWLPSDLEAFAPLGSLDSYVQYCDTNYDTWWRYWGEAKLAREECRRKELLRLASAAPKVPYYLLDRVQVSCEFGAGEGIISAFLGYWSNITCHAYDRIKTPQMAVLEGVAGKQLVFHQEDANRVKVPPCELLWIDADKTYESVRQMLFNNHERVRDHIVVVGTERWKDQGARVTGIGSWHELDSKGIGPAVDEFLEWHRGWRKQQHITEGDGMTILRRVT